MNYIIEIKEFYDLVIDNSLSTGQIALWHALMYINNRCHWTENFSVPNITLQLYTGLSLQGMIKARNTLKQRGLIDFTVGKKGTTPVYKIIEVPKSVTKSITNGITKVELSAQQKCNKSVTLNKQQTENTNITPIIPFGGKLKEKVSEWLAYKAERREKYKDTGLKAFFTKVQNLVNECGEYAVITALDTAMANNWKGFFPEKAEKSNYDVYNDNYSHKDLEELTRR